MEISWKNFSFSQRVFPPRHSHTFFIALHFCANIDFPHSVFSDEASSSKHQNPIFRWVVTFRWGNGKTNFKLRPPPKVQFRQVFAEQTCWFYLPTADSFFACKWWCGEGKTIMLFQYLIKVSYHSKGPAAGGAVKIPNMPGGDGYWLDPSGVIWRSNPRTKGNHIPDYAPVCTGTTTTTLPVEDETRHRWVLSCLLSAKLN